MQDMSRIDIYNKADEDRLKGKKEKKEIFL